MHKSIGESIIKIFKVLNMEESIINIAASIINMTESIIRIFKVSRIWQEVL